LSGSQPKAPGFAGGYLLFTQQLLDAVKVLVERVQRLN
jgi:hypothetical protein